MNKLIISLLCALLISSCSLNVEELLLPPTATVAPSLTSTVTPTQAPTFTATVATPTFTYTPTLAGLKTATSTSVFTPTSSTITPLAQFTPNTPTPAVEMEGFVNVFISDPEFFKPGICEPKTVKFTAQVANAAGTAFVVLFVRFKSKQTDATSEWTSITIKPFIPGTFVHDLKAVDMKGVDIFTNAWVQYQFVATDSKSNEIGRTGVFAERLSLLDCRPTPTSLTPSTATPTP